MRPGDEDLDRVPVVQRGVQRDEPAVDPRAHALVAHIGVDGVGEVDRGRPLRQRDHVPFGGEHEDLVGVQVEAQAVEELAGFGALPLPVEDLAQPGGLVGPGGAPPGTAAVPGRTGPGAAVGESERACPGLPGGPGADAVLLVLPVRRDPVLGPVVHRVRADLQLDGLALGADHRRVQRLVHVELGHRDVVLEPARDRLPVRVDGAQGGVAVPQGVDQHPDPDQVVDVVEGPAADHHLLIDRVVVLGPAGDDSLDPGLGQVRLHLHHHRGDVGVPAGRAVGHQPDDLVVTLRVERREGEILQLPLQRVHPEPVGQRSVDLQGLPGLALLLVLGQEAQRAHVVQAGGKLDHKGPGVAGHRDHHPPDRLGLRGLADLHPVQLHHRVEHQRDVVAELVPDPLERHAALADGAVQERGAQGRRVHPEIGEDARDRDGMGDVGVAGEADLAGVHPRRGLEGVVDRADVGPRMVREQAAQHRIQQ